MTTNHETVGDVPSADDVTDADLRLHAGEMTASEVRACRAGYRLAMSRIERAQARESAAALKVDDEMVRRFLSWPLPLTFSPGQGITFRAPDNPMCWPTGTDLLNDPEARAMLQHVLGGAASAQAQGYRDGVAHEAGAGRVPAEMQVLYDAASKGFRTTVTNGADSRYEHVSSFRNIEDLHSYGRAFADAMKALSATPDPKPTPEGEARLSGVERVADAIAYHDAKGPLDSLMAAFSAMDNGDTSLAEWPQRAVDALAVAGWAVVPCSLPYAVLGDAAIAGVFETGNPKHGWDYLIARTRITPDGVPAQQPAPSDAQDDPCPILAWCMDRELFDAANDGPIYPTDIVSALTEYEAALVAAAEVAHREGVRLYSAQEIKAEVQRERALAYEEGRQAAEERLARVPSDAPASPQGAQGDVEALAIKPTRCSCHPETCCCGEYALHIDGEMVITGSRKQLEAIVAAARRLRNSPQPDVAAEVLRIADEREAGYARREHGAVVNGKAADAVVALAESLRNPPEPHSPGDSLSLGGAAGKAVSRSATAGNSPESPDGSFSLLSIIADIRAAAGDPTGKLMQGELVAHIRALREDAERHRALRAMQWTRVDSARPDQEVADGA